MSIINPFLSIWEIAHRYYDTNPDSTDPNDPPQNIKDILRGLTWGVECNGLHFNKIGSDEHTSPPDILNELKKRQEKLNENETCIIVDKDFLERSYHELFEDPEFYTDLSMCYKNRECNKQLLDNIYLEKEEVFHFFKKHNEPIPNFWYSDKEILELSDIYEIKKESEFRPSKEAKLCCRAIAQTLWLQDPYLTIEDIKKHEAIQKFGGGEHYQGRDTIRNWIKDLNPNKAKGRPPKKIP